MVPYHEGGSIGATGPARGARSEALAELREDMTDGQANGVDGRRQRGERSRAQIAEAMLELVREAGAMPTMEMVADRAGVSRRSVFRHFADISELLTAAYELERADVFRRYPVRDPATWDEAQRIDAFAERVGDVYEHVSPVRQAAVHLARDYPVLERLMREDDQIQRGVLLNLFGPSLEAAPAAERPTVLAAMASSSSWTTWRALRQEHELSVDETRAAVRLSLRALLDRARTLAG